MEQVAHLLNEPILAKGPTNRELVGIVLRNRLNSIQVLSDLVVKHGDIVNLPFGMIQGHLLNHPKLIQHVLVDNWKNYPKSDRYKVLQSLIGNGIFTSNGERWKNKRSQVQPFFNPAAITQHANSIRSIADQTWNAIPVDTPFDLYEKATEITFRTISRIVFGADVEKHVTSFREIIEELSVLTVKRVMNPFPFLDNFPSATNIAFKKCAKQISNIVSQLIQERLEGQSSENQKMDLLQMYINRLEDRSPFGINELKNDLITFIIAGSETTALSVTWAIYELSRPRHQSYLHRARASNEFLNHAISETLRLYPPIWLMGRQAENDDSILGLEIKKGSQIFISPYLMQRHPGFWSNPSEFLPERFENPTFENFAYLPFSHGPRYCVGKNLALLEINEILKSFFNRFSHFENLNTVNVTPRGLMHLYPSSPIKLAGYRKESLG